MQRSLQQNDKLTLHKEFGNLTMDLILAESETRKSMWMLQKENEDDLLLTIKLLLIDLAKSINVVRNMNRDQIDECAILLMDEFKNLKLEEVYLVIKRIKTGEVKILDRLDAQIILGEFRRYFEERTVRVIQLNDQKHIQQKALGAGGKRSSEDLTDEKEANKKAHISYLMQQGKL